MFKQVPDVDNQALSINISAALVHHRPLAQELKQRTNKKLRSKMLRVMISSSRKNPMLSPHTRRWNIHFIRTSDDDDAEIPSVRTFESSEGETAFLIGGASTISDLVLFDGEGPDEIENRFGIWLYAVLTSSTSGKSYQTYNLIHEYPPQRVEQLSGYKH